MTIEGSIPDACITCKAFLWQAKPSMRSGGFIMGLEKYLSVLAPLSFPGLFPTFQRRHKWWRSRTFEVVALGINHFWSCWSIYLPLSFFWCWTMNQYLLSGVEEDFLFANAASGFRRLLNTRTLEARLRLRMKLSSGSLRRRLSPSSLPWSTGDVAALW